jgi:hypothetical protein
MFRDCGDKVPITPEFTSPEIFAQFGKLFEESFSGDGFKRTDDITAAVLGVEGAEYVDMVTISTQLFKPDVVAVGDL